ncbi:hypothetical protein ID866_10869 [Astraeus odoratus]|nr:hypothetical protein ID866_10869 [Astraeus odoratus]
MDRTLYLWDVETGIQVGSPLQGLTNPVMPVTFSPNGGQIISGSYDQTICLWDVEGVVISPDGRITSGSHVQSICFEMLKQVSWWKTGFWNTLSQFIQCHFPQMEGGLYQFQIITWFDPGIQI